MTLPTIPKMLAKLNLRPEDIPEDQAKAIVYQAIEADLAEGLHFLTRFQSKKWADEAGGQDELCSHCALPDIDVRRQVIRLSAYSPLRQYVYETMGLNIGMHVFSATSDDAGPSSRLIVRKAGRPLEASPERTLQVMQWGKTAEPPPAKSRTEATEILWQHAQTNLAAGLNHLRQSMAPEYAETGLPGTGELIPELLELVGVDGMHMVINEKLGQQFHLYNCHVAKPQDDLKPKPKGGRKLPKDADAEGENAAPIFSSVSFRTQLLHQAEDILMHC